MKANSHRASAATVRKEAAGPYTITELAQEFDITPRAIRFYEDVGLLMPGREGRNRVYTHRDRTRLKLTLRGKRLGLTLQEIKQLVDMYESPDDTAPQLQAFLAVLQSHREQLEQQKDDLEVTLAEISQHEARCRDLLSAAARRTAKAASAGPCAANVTKATNPTKAASRAAAAAGPGGRDRQAPRRGRSKVPVEV